MGRGCAADLIIFFILSPFFLISIQNAFLLSLKVFFSHHLEAVGYVSDDDRGVLSKFVQFYGAWTDTRRKTVAKVRVHAVTNRRLEICELPKQSFFVMMKFIELPQPLFVSTVFPGTRNPRSHRILKNTQKVLKLRRLLK